MKRRWWMLLSVPLLAAMATGCQQAQSGPPRTTPIAVYDLPVTRVVTDFEEFPGETASPYSVDVRARVSGYLNDPVYFKDGTMVTRDAKLFQIDPRMYKADLDRAEGTVRQYEAHVERLQKEYNRAKSLLGRATASISQEEHDRYKADYEEAEANLEVAKANRDLARLNLEWTEVRAPISGLLSRRLVDPGNLIKADDTILTSVVSLDPLYVYFDVHEQAMLRLKRLMQSGKLKLQAQGAKEVPVLFGLSDEADFQHRGVVDFTDNKVDLNTGTLRFRARIENPADEYGNRFIVPGLFVRVRLPIGDPHPALMIPEQSLVTDQGRKTVFVLAQKKDKDGKVEKDEKGEPKYIATVRDVGNVGVLRDGYREIEKGVEPGDFVVRAGMQRLRPGMEVKPERYDEKALTGKASEKGEPAKGAAGHDTPAAKDAGAAKVEGAAPAGAGPATAPAGTGSAAKAEGSGDPWNRTPPIPSGKGAGGGSRRGGGRGGR